MGDMDVDPSVLLARSGKFREAAEGQVQAGAHDQNQTESDIAAFGEINAALHDNWRAARARQAQSWSGVGREHDEHADKLVTAARGYEGQDEVNAQMLRAGDSVLLPGVPGANPQPPPAPGTERQWLPSPGDANHPPQGGYGSTLPDAPRSG
jgi:hypothetical protein